MTEKKKEEKKEEKKGIEYNVKHDYAYLAKKAGDPKHTESINTLLDDMQNLRFVHFYDKLKDQGQDFSGKSDDEKVTLVRTLTDDYKVESGHEAEHLADKLGKRVLREIDVDSKSKMAEEYEKAMALWYKPGVSDAEKDKVRGIMKNSRDLLKTYGYDWHGIKGRIHSEGFTPHLMESISSTVGRYMPGHKRDLYFSSISEGDKPDLIKHIVNSGKKEGLKFSDTALHSEDLDELKNILVALHTDPRSLKTKRYKRFLK